MAEPAVKANELVKWFGEGEARTFAVRGVSFEARFGEMLYIVGPSGSGKTTLLRNMLRWEKDLSGCDALFLLNVRQPPPAQLASLLQAGKSVFVFLTYFRILVWKTVVCHGRL